MTRRLLGAVCLAFLLLPGLAHSDPGGGTVYTGAAFMVGDLHGERFGAETSLGPGMAAYIGIKVASWLGFEVRARLLDINSYITSPWMFDMGFGPRFNIEFGPIRVQPTFSLGMAYFQDRCVDILAYGESCYGPDAGHFTPGILLGYQWEDHLFGASYAHSFLFDQGQAWHVVAVEWSTSLGD